MENKEIISTHDVEERMIVLRNQTVIADADVAALYGVETRRINEAVRNNRNRFPHGYMFELTDREFIGFAVENFDYKYFLEKSLFD